MQAQAAAVAAAADPFAGAPSFVFQLSFTPKRMAWFLCSLMRDLQTAVARQSATEDVEGRVKVWVHGYHRLLLTPDGGFFIVLLTPPPNLGRPVKLLFGFRDLYLKGFEHGGLWYVFSDADLGGIDIDAHPRVRNMGFGSGYTGNVFEEVHIAVNDLLLSYFTLLDGDNRPPHELYRALYRLMVTVSEALRFLDWMKELVRIYRESVEEPAVNKDGVYFGYHFNNWSNRSKAVRKGANAFVGPQYGFRTYEELLSFSGVVLSR